MLRYSSVSAVSRAEQMQTATYDLFGVYPHSWSIPPSYSLTTRAVTYELPSNTVWLPVISTTTRAFKSISRLFMGRTRTATFTFVPDILASKLYERLRDKRYCNKIKAIYLKEGQEIVL
jgi:hypothetical protein